MIVGGVLLDERLRAARLRCRVELCRGLCCVIGDEGPPVTREEADRIAARLPEILERIPPEAREALSRGVATRGRYGLALATVGGTGPCALISWESGVARCVLEQLADASRPHSCRLFPIRLEEEGGLPLLRSALVSECDPCRGEQPVHRQVEEALVERFGREWFEALEATLGS